MSTRLRLLIVDESEKQAAAIVEELRRAGYRPTYQRAGSTEDLQAALQRDGFDVIITPTASKAKQILREHGIRTPVIPKGGRSGLAATVRRETGASPQQSPEEEEAVSRLAAIVESSEDAIIGKTLDGTIQSWNAGAERLYGYSAAEAIGRPMTLVVPPDRAVEETDILRRLQRGERLEHFETVRIRKDGELINVSLAISPIRSKDGRIIGASHIARDITERKRAEASRLESEDRFRKMADAAPVMIWIAGPNKLCTYFNKGWLDFTGRTLDQGVERGWGAGVHPNDLEYCLETYAKSFDRREPFRMEYRLRRADGVYRWVLDHGIPIFEPTFKGYVGSCIDITERKLAEEERAELLAREQAARADAENANRLKDEFLATISHELRTPLTAILGWARLSLSSPMQERPRREGLEIILRNAKAQAKLIEDILDVSRIITGKMRLRVEPVDFTRILAAGVQSMRPAAHAKGIQLNEEIDPRIGVVLGDAERLQQVIWNLLSNAVKFTPTGGHVDVRVDRINSHIEVTVQDTGEGIRPEFLPHLFERFRQSDSSSTRQHGGLGLGLAIVRHLVELHGGSVRAESPGPGKGATFTVRLPLLACPTEAEVMPEIPSPPLTEAEKVPEEALSGFKILVVDDEPDTCSLLSTILRQAGAIVTGVCSASEALAKLEADHGKPDLLIADIAMPGEDGYALIKRIRARESERAEERPLPAIALTAYARPDDRQKALEAGYQMHLSKPIEPNDLVAAARSLV